MNGGGRGPLNGGAHFLLFLSGPCCYNVLPLTYPFLLTCVSVPGTPARMPTGIIY
jgi:hypothetical protein